MYRGVAVLVKAESKGEALWKLTDFMKKECNVNCFLPDYGWSLGGWKAFGIASEELNPNTCRKLDDPGFYEEFMASWPGDHYAIVNKKRDEIRQALDSGLWAFEQGKDLALGLSLKELGDLLCQNFNTARVFNLETYMYDVPGKDDVDFAKYYMVIVDIHS
jgi:hypothetical protein